jgi:hypothetical protein
MRQKKINIRIRRNAAQLFGAVIMIVKQLSNTIAATISKKIFTVGIRLAIYWIR